MIRAFGLVLLLPLLACGGGGNGDLPFTNPANPPQGAGVYPIDMSGTWRVRAVTPLEITTLNPNPPTSDDNFNILPRNTGGFALVSITNERADRSSVEDRLGIRLSAYINNGDGAILQYGFIAQHEDRRVTIGIFFGALDPSTMLAEMVTVYDIFSAGTREVDRYLVRLER
ncbi:MAG: hypothetical protein IPM29_09330 [Planctomycetes bacterium]|nr:hypothetical protein [Planctomycetota bacterium]